MPTTTDNMSQAWDREYHQRDCLIRGIKQIDDIKDTDVILINDCDEIPNVELLEQMKIHGINIFKDENNLKFAFERNPDFEIKDIVGFRQELYYYNIECKFNGIWSYGRALTYGKLKEIGSANTARRFYQMDKSEYYENAGWHFSYFGDADHIINKIKNFAHQEFNLEENLIKDKIEERIKNNKDPYGRDYINFTHFPIELNSNLPKNYKMLL